jgi:hypothetical protein
MGDGSKTVFSLSNTMRIVIAGLNDAVRNASFQPSSTAGADTD